MITIAVVGLACLLRGVRLSQTPGWDGDEGYNVEIAWQLLHGRAQAFAVSQSFVQHPILFYAVLAPLLGAFGRELWVARLLAAGSGALAAGLIYLAVTRGSGTRPALLAALAFSWAPLVVLHNRLAYTYNLLLLWSAATLLFVTLWEERRARRWLAAACVCAALGLLTDQVGIALPVFVALRQLPRKRVAAWSLAASVTPAAVAALLMLALSPQAALEDWWHSLFRVGGAAPGAPDGGTAVRIALWFVNYLHLLRAEWWWPAAIAGLFMVCPMSARRRVLTLSAVLVVPVFALRELEPFFRTGIPLLLPGAIGIGALLDRAFAAVYRTVPHRAASAVVVSLVAILPLGLELARTGGALATRFTTRFDWALVVEQDDARSAAAYVNRRVAPGDLVLVSPHVSWLYRGEVADFFQAVAWTGQPVAFYPADMPRERFRFDLSVDRARFVVLDPFWERWIEASAPLETLTRQIRSWPEELRAGPFSVRRNPRF